MGLVSIDVARNWRAYGSPSEHLVREDGLALGLRLTSETVQISGAGWSVAQLPRQGRKPLSRRDSPGLLSMSFTNIVTRASDPGGNSVTEVIRDALDFAESGYKCRPINVSNDVETRGWWWPSLAVTITDRDDQQQAKRAELAWTLLEAVDERPEIAQLPPPPPPPPPPAVANTPPAGQGDYTVVKGDSLWKIAARFLGNGERWRELYDLNQARLNLKPPEMYRGLLTVWIYPGQVLQIPAR